MTTAMTTHMTTHMTNAIINVMSTAITAIMTTAIAVNKNSGITLGINMTTYYYFWPHQIPPPTHTPWSHLGP